MIGQIAKRGMDIVAALCGIVLAAPLLLITATAIMCSSAGPILFLQRRIGRNGIPFTIYKFRTMEIDHQPALQPVRGDHQKLTPIGNFLRNTGIDELPQLWNVLRGDMALVGPRPHADYHVSYYSEHIPEYRERLCVRPGITGAVQVSNIRNASQTIEEVRAQVALDLAYIRGWHLLRDIRICLQTVWVLVMRYRSTRKHYCPDR
jgi:putative colanic acid biosynthesis UDP-glucose lipid carrier transferase